MINMCVLKISYKINDQIKVNTLLFLECQKTLKVHLKRGWDKYGDKADIYMFFVLMPNLKN